MKISNKIIEKYPDLNVSVVVARDLDNSGDSEEIQKMMREMEKQMQDKINPEEVSTIPVIAKWREIYRSFGSKPSDFRNSAEAILKRALKGELPKINLLVDIYNYLSLKYTLTAGGENIDKMKGDLVLDFATGDEEFKGIGDEENDSPLKGEVIYKDDLGVVCRRWNWREADRTKLTEETKNVILVMENFIPEENEKLEQATEELKSLVEKYCKANCEVKILNKENMEIEI